LARAAVADFLADRLNDFLLDLRGGNRPAGFEYDEATGRFSLQAGSCADVGAFGDGRMSRGDLFHAASRKTTPRDIDDVVDAAHDEQIAGPRP